MGRVLSEESRALFPISTIESLVRLFRTEFVEKTEEPSLALASIILGALEHALTAPQVPAPGPPIIQQSPFKSSKDNTGPDFPPLDYDVVVALYDKFKSKIKSTVNTAIYTRDKEGGTGTSRELVKNVSDVVWNSLSRSYMTNSPHIQSLYTYLTGNKLDCFGLALAVVAGCQILGRSDVHLALSEDHSWVVFGPNGELNAEVTWHGKGNEDKRGQSIEDTHSWLYLKGFPVNCNRHMEIAAIVSAINPSINGSSDSTELGVIQQKLLWFLYDAGHLERYPMAIGNLADLEEISATAGRKSCVDLFEEGIRSNKLHYNNMHVYPYTYYAGYLYRREEYREALKCWAEAAQVISHYRHSKLDEEIYKEFLDITKEQLTAMMKQVSTGINAHSLTRDPASYAQLLKFFDGICLWEESSSTPVLHIVWAKAWIGALGKFEFGAREGVRILSSDQSVCDKNTSRGADLNGNNKDMETDEEETLTVLLRSFKMKGVKDLLQREKFNPAALTLHLTAQPTLGGTPAGRSTTYTTGPAGSETSAVIGGRSRKNKTKEEPTPVTELGSQSRAKRAKKEK